MPLNRNKTGQFVLIEVLPLMRLAARRYKQSSLSRTIDFAG